HGPKLRIPGFLGPFPAMRDGIAEEDHIHVALLGSCYKRFMPAHPTFVFLVYRSGARVFLFLGNANASKEYENTNSNQQSLHDGVPQKVGKTGREVLDAARGSSVHNMRNGMVFGKPTDCRPWAFQPVIPSIGAPTTTPLAHRWASASRRAATG